MRNFYETRMKGDYGLKTSWFLAIAVGLVFLLIVVTFIGVQTAKRHSCMNKLNAYNREGYYDILSGCFVRLDDGTYIEAHKYRVNIELEEEAS